MFMSKLTRHRGLILVNPPKSEYKSKDSKNIISEKLLSQFIDSIA